LDGLAQK